MIELKWGQHASSSELTIVLETRSNGKEAR